MESKYGWIRYVSDNDIGGFVMIVIVRDIFIEWLGD